MMALAGAAVFLFALALLAMPMFRGTAVMPEQLLAAAAFVIAALAFGLLVFRGRVMAQFTLAAAAVFFIVWCLAFVLPEDH